MRRRQIIALVGSAATVPLPAAAQPAALPVIGYLGNTPFEAAQAAFRDGLKERGHVEGRTAAIAFRWAEGHNERFPALIAELLALKVAVIVSPVGQGALAARQATRTVPIVFLVSDPVAVGMVASLARPGGNATGVNAYVSELVSKRLELLRQLIPGARSVAFLSNPASPTAAAQLHDLQAAVRVLGFELGVLEARSADEIEQAFQHLAARRPDALLVGSDALYFRQRAQIAGLAARHAVPAIYDWPDFVAAGGLFAYGPNLLEFQRLLGTYAGAILNGAHPADLPVLQPSRFELVINLRTAKALGLAVPPTILARADEVIE
jgi:putative ABC transport system substrate-binding protein